MLKLAICSHRGRVAYGQTSAGMQVHAAGPDGLVAAVASQLGATWLYVRRRARVIARSRAGTSTASHSRHRAQAAGSAASRSPRAYEVISCALLAPLFHHMFSFTSAPVFTPGVRDAWAALSAHQRGLRRRGLPLWSARRRAGGGHAVDARRRRGARSRERPDVRLAYFITCRGVIRRTSRSFQRGYARRCFARCSPMTRLAFTVVAGRTLHAFTARCERFLPGRTRRRRSRPMAGPSDRRRGHPAATEACAVRASSASSDAVIWRERSRSLKGDCSLFVRVERADPSKNAIRGRGHTSCRWSVAPTWRRRRGCSPSSRRSANGRAPRSGHASQTSTAAGAVRTCGGLAPAFNYALVTLSPGTRWPDVLLVGQLLR